MLMFLGSVPSSGRPPLEMTALTYGKSAIVRRSLRNSPRASSTETEVGKVDRKSVV
jgi:hypothetical protein